MGEAFIERLLLVTGCVAAVFGTLGTVRGVDDVRGDPRQRGGRGPDEWLANVDSEFRFFAAWYAAVGVETVRTACSAEPERQDVGWVGAAWLASALGRALSIRSRGRPHALYLVLMTLEVAVGILLCGRARRGRLSSASRRGPWS